LGWKGWDYETQKENKTAREKGKEVSEREGQKKRRRSDLGPWTKRCTTAIRLHTTTLHSPTPRTPPHNSHQTLLPTTIHLRKPLPQSLARHHLSRSLTAAITKFPRSKGRNISERFTSRHHDRDWIFIYPIPKAYFRVRIRRGVDGVLLSEVDILDI